MGQSNEQKPWERRPRETAKAFRAFACFRDLGEERSIAQAARVVDRHVSLLRRWAARHEWWSRVHAFDQETDRQERATRVRERADSLRRHRQQGQQLQQLAMLGLSDLVQRDAVTGKVTLTRQIKPREAAALLRLGIELENGLAPAAEEREAREDSVATLLQRKPDGELEQLLERLEPHTSVEETGDDVKE